MTSDSIASRFADRLKDSIIESRKLGYNPSVFEGMLNSYGAVGAAKRLLLPSEGQTGLKRLISLGRKDLTVEAIMLEPEFSVLFSEQELEAAAWHLSQCS